ncbi:60S acidic ribosomal protein P2-3 [Thelohanellus kitauei]|uniref:Large ribosomal subunit protein P2 n=1 Tax=Thelohanellus kitauei TaxID=669202 RepID=A0A0C2N4Z5_THEKT|nr:60S acidic ribosomal protein P2-3 [Thelohanellus kitauei]
MKYIAAYALAKLGGEENPTVLDLEMIILAGEGQFDKNQAELVVTRLKGKDIEDLIQQGKLKISSIAPAAAMSAAPVQGTKAAAVDVMPEKKQESESESSDEGGGLGSLFD